MSTPQIACPYFRGMCCCQGAEKPVSARNTPTSSLMNFGDMHFWKLIPIELSESAKIDQHISSNLWHLSFNDLSTKAEFQATSGDGALHIPKDLRGQVMPWRQRLQRGVANQLFWLYTSKHYLWVTKIQTFSFTWVAAVLFVSKICV